MRQQLHEYIDTAEKKKLKAIYTLAEGDIIENFTLSDEQKKKLDRRHDEYVNGIGETYNWDETVAAARQQFAEGKNIFHPLTTARIG